MRIVSMIFDVSRIDFLWLGLESNHWHTQHTQHKKKHTVHTAQTAFDLIFVIAFKASAFEAVFKLRSCHSIHHHITHTHLNHFCFSLLHFDPLQCNQSASTQWQWTCTRQMLQQRISRDMTCCCGSTTVYKLNSAKSKNYARVSGSRTIVSASMHFVVKFETFLCIVAPIHTNIDSRT